MTSFSSLTRADLDPPNTPHTHIASVPNRNSVEEKVAENYWRIRLTGYMKGARVGKSGFYY